MAGMNAPTLIGTTVVTGGIEDEATYARSSVTITGDVAKLSRYSPDKARMVEVDVLRDAKIDERSDGTVIVEGVSDELKREVGLPDKDSHVRWVVTPRGCDQC